MAALLVVMLLGRSPVASGQADDDSSVSVSTKGEVSTYGDTNDVYVYTPAVTAGIEHPLDGWSVHGGYLVDVVSAASVDIVSTATPAWQEVRHAGNLSGTYKPDTFGVTVGGSISREPDYLSLNGGGNVSLDLLDKNLQLLAGYTYAHDTAGRTGTPFDVYSLGLDRHSINGAVNVIVDRDTVLSFTVDAILEGGRQEKPYRYVAMFDADVAETIPAGASADLVNRERLPGRVAEFLPDSRGRYALSGRVAQRLEETTFVAWERVYTDDWGVKASTTDLRIVFDTSDRFYIWPHLRGHVQSGTSFWSRAYVASFPNGGTATLPKLRTGDRELSPLVGFTGGVGARWDLNSRHEDTLYSLIFLGDGAVTRYSDTLFIQSRTAIFGALQLEVTFR